MPDFVPTIWVPGMPLPASTSDSPSGPQDPSLWAKHGYRPGMSKSDWFRSRFQAWKAADVGRRTLSDEAAFRIFNEQYGGMMDAEWREIERVGKEEEKEAASEAESRSIREGIGRFIELMEAPSQDAQGNWVDPVAKQLASVSSAQAGVLAGRSGLAGSPTAVGANQATMLGAVTPWLQQKQGLALQGRQLLSQRDLSLRDLSIQRGQLDLQRAALENKYATDKWASEQNAAQGLWGTLGAIGGGIIGGIAGGPPGIMAGASIGAGVGSSLANVPAPQYSTPRYRTYH